MTDRYAVTGHPLGHTKSPFIHTSFARSTGQDMEYLAIEAAPGSFRETAEAFRASGGRGLNITAPFKLDAFAFATEHSEAARLAGAANALSFDDDGRIRAENFDGVGLVNDVQRNLGLALACKRVLMLGAGGAARSALLPFLAQGPAAFVLVNRDTAKARELAARVAGAGPITAAGYDELGDAPFDLVLNATSASLRAELPPVPPGVFAGHTLAYELAYGKGLTPFLALARQAGAARLADGVGMLVEQAAEAFAWWRGVRPATGEVIRALTVPLA
ncbi:shikimate dehydrogenase [Derxia gummosa]|uniref:Shikimate dehydrogenase (NADP(+)) n=1 Tax=Derxia gummosa DSM 723 TaxID=1121388 RepID=A0A8B6X3B7_9BURK|nr:shikimate dehydrogenase [Derxia gummosa]